MNIFVLRFRVHLISCMLLCALCSLCNEHKLNKKNGGDHSVSELNLPKRSFGRLENLLTLACLETYCHWVPEFGWVQSLDWSTGLDYWTGLLD